MVQTRANFSIRGDLLVPQDITGSLDLVPTIAWMKGDPFQTRTGVHHRPWGIWSLRTDGLVNSADLEDHILFMLQRIEPKRARLVRYLEDPAYLVQVYLWYVGESGYTVKSPLLSRLCSVCELVNFSFFETPESSGDPEGG